MGARVGFSTTARVYDIPHVSDMPEEVIEELWFTADELRRIKKGVFALARAVANGSAPKNVYTRGLEVLVCESPTAERDTVEDSITSIVALKDRQISEGKSDPDALRQRYLESTEKYSYEARTRGVLDARAVGIKAELPKKASDTRVTESKTGKQSKESKPKAQKSTFKRFMSLTGRRRTTRA